MPTTDIIDELAGIVPGSAVDSIRLRRPAARENAQISYLLLLHPDDPSDVTQAERRAVAAFVALLHADAPIAAHYRALLGDGGLSDAIAEEAERAFASGPYGAYAKGPLSVEDAEGPTYRASERAVAVLGGRLAAALEHAHLLVFHPRDAKAEALGRLLSAGWSPDAVVTLSQLVSFLAFQIRAVIGLRALADAGEAA